jgi:hypothetical protein
MRNWNLQLEWKPQDLWIGAFWKRDGNRFDLWVCILPCLPVHFSCWGVESSEGAQEVTSELIDEAVNCAWHVAGTTLHSREDIKAAVKAIYPMFVGTFIRTPAQPPSIPEPSESDVTEAAMTMCDAWCYAPRGTPDWNLHWNFNDPKYMTQARAAITTYTARLRERIGGEG